MWCLVVFQHDRMPSTFPKVKKSYSWGTSSDSKEEVYLRQHFTQTESHKANIIIYGGITRQMNFNYPRCWKYCAKWHQLGIKLRYSSLKCSKQTLTVRSAIVNSFTSFVFSSEANGETKKNSFSPVEDFTPFQWHSGTQKLVGIAK